MFDFLSMAGNYEERKVANYQGANGLNVDTCLVTDSLQPYETAVAHNSYNESKWIIVEMYDTKEEAQVGHDKWVKIMTAPNLPKTLKDVSSSAIMQFADIVGANLTKEFEI